MSGITRTGSVLAADLSVSVDDVRTVENCAARAWPPTTVTDLGGWQLRSSPGVSNRRSNSVLPIFGKKTDQLVKKIARVEAFYAGRGLPSRFMISPASMPEDLDQVLADQEYFIDAPTFVQWAKSHDVRQTCQVAGDVELISAPTTSWMSVYMSGVQDTAEVALKSQLIKRIEADHVLAQISNESGPIAVGLAVCEQDWVGIFCMHTLKSHRRQGTARQILGALASWALNKGAANMYLQVESENLAARQFYEAARFVTQYGYHYRTKENGRASQ